MTWRDYAACRDLGPSVMFPETHDGWRRARSICAQCPYEVRQACVDNENPGQYGRHGCRAGLTPAERHNHRPGDPVPVTVNVKARPIPECGTQPGWVRHRRSRTEPCQPCQDAHTEWVRAKNKRARELRGPAPVKVPDCGTVAAYRRHLRIGETPCQPCRDAEAARRAKPRRRTDLERRNLLARLEAELHGLGWIKDSDVA